MNTYQVSTPLLNEGKETVLWSPLSEGRFKNQLAEVFMDQHYKAALTGKKDMVIVDIGGNMGLSALYFAPYAKMIYVIEPSFQHFQALLENTKGYKNIKAIRAAISASNGTEEIFDNDSQEIPESFFGKGKALERVESITLEKLIDDNNIEHIDVLKVDCEGAEYIMFPSIAFGKVASKIDLIIGEAHYFEIFIPEFVPMILSEYGYKTRFLPIENFYRLMSFNHNPLFLDKDFELRTSTMFVAERES